MTVTDLAAAVEQSRFDVALRTAVTLWQGRRDDVLADLIDAISARCQPMPIVGRDKARFQRAWLARAAEATADPVARTALCEGLLRSVPLRKVDYFAKKRDVKVHRDFLDRIEALASCEVDPRTATALVDVIVRGPFSVEANAEIYGPVLELLVTIGDRRSAARLRELDARPIAKTQGFRSYLDDTLLKIVERIEAVKRSVLRGKDREIATELLGALVTPVTAPARAGDLDTLHAECLAHPDDDALRSVYADALLEGEDPRGEFIQLQLREQRELDVPEQKRIESLQRKHDKAWLGDIARVTKLRVFRRGFLEECELLQGAAAEPAIWREIAADPRLATVRVLCKGSASEELYRSFVFSPAMKSLRDVEVQSTEMLRALPKIGRPIESIRLAMLTREALEIVGKIAKQVGVRRLAFETRETPSALRQKLGSWGGRESFDELTVIPHYRVNREWRDDWLTWLLAFEPLEPVKRLSFVWDAHHRISSTQSKRGLEIEIAANEDWLVGAILSAKLPAPISRLVVRGRPTSWLPPTAGVKRALKKLPLGMLELREGWAALLTPRGKAAG